MEICGQRYAHNGYATLPDTNSQFMGFQDIKTLILVLKEIINSFLQKNYHNPERFRKVHYTSGLFVPGCFLRLSNESMTKRRVNPTFTLDRPKRKLLQGRSPSHLY